MWYYSKKYFLFKKKYKIGLIFLFEIGLILIIMLEYFLEINDNIIANKSLTRSQLPPNRPIYFIPIVCLSMCKHDILQYILEKIYIINDTFFCVFIKMFKHLFMLLS